MAEIWTGVKSERHQDRLDALAREAKRDLDRLCFPAANWVLPANGPDGRAMLDVLIIGAGLCGQTLGFALMRDGIRNVRIVDRNPVGREGPWGTTARMQILRSPKQLTGPDLGVPSLTFRAWYEAQHGETGWASLHKAGRLDWRDYLLWVRDTVGVAVENGVEATAIEPEAAGIRVTLRTAGGTEIVYARKVVLAGGRDGSGGPRLPQFPGLAADTPRYNRVFHSSDEIDFAAFVGQRVAVLGAGASAFDCAGTALEAGAAEVILFLRRPHLPQVNKSKWTAFPGFLKGFAGLDDATRWRFYTYIFDEQVPPPYESVLRCDAHPNFSIRFGEAWTDVVAKPDGVTIHTSSGAHDFAAVILGTGFDVDLALRPELASFRDDILLWRDRVSPQEATLNPECARFPYVGPGFELLERKPGSRAGLSTANNRQAPDPVKSRHRTPSRRPIASLFNDIWPPTTRRGQGRRSLLIKQRERTVYPQLTDVPSDLRVNGARHASRESLPPSKPFRPLMLQTMSTRTIPGPSAILCIVRLAGPCCGPCGLIERRFMTCTLSAPRAESMLGGSDTRSSANRERCERFAPVRWLEDCIRPDRRSSARRSTPGKAGGMGAPVRATGCTGWTLQDQQPLTCPDRDPHNACVPMWLSPAGDAGRRPPASLSRPRTLSLAVAAIGSDNKR